MNDHELWETTMDPTTRILKQVTLDEAADADETFAILMGDDVDDAAPSSSATPPTCASSTSEQPRDQPSPGLVPSGPDRAETNVRKKRERRADY
mgnify:CR=1 FL=1